MDSKQQEIVKRAIREALDNPPPENPEAMKYWSMWWRLMQRLDGINVKDIKTFEVAIRNKCIKEIEDARQEHNVARHGDSIDDAYDRACDAINPALRSL